MTTDKPPAVPLGKPTPPPAVRASDADRDRVADILREALAEGRLQADEHAERIEVLYAAKTVPELEKLIHDLPAGQRTAPSPRPTARENASRPPGPRNVVAVLGGADRGGSWRVGAQINAVAVCGGVDIDLTEAIFDHPEVVITATAICGGIGIQVPENVTLVCEGTGIMGAFEAREMVAADPGAPVVRVRGVAIWGAVEVSAVEGKRVQNLRDAEG